MTEARWTPWRERRLPALLGTVKREGFKSDLSTTVNPCTSAVGRAVAVVVLLELLHLRAEIAARDGGVSPVDGLHGLAEDDLARGVHDVGIGMVDCLRKILRSVLVVFAPHDVFIGVREEVALMGDLNWVVWEDATEVVEAGAFKGDEAVE